MQDMGAPLFRTLGEGSLHTLFSENFGCREQEYIAEERGLSGQSISG